MSWDVYMSIRIPSISIPSFPNRSDGIERRGGASESYIRMAQDYTSYLFLRLTGNAKASVGRIGFGYGSCASFVLAVRNMIVNILRGGRRVYICLV